MHFTEDTSAPPAARMNGQATDAAKSGAALWSHKNAVGYGHRARGASRLLGEAVDVLRAGLIGTAPLAPVVGAVLALATYFAKGWAGLPSPSLEVGIASLLMAWLGLGVVYALLGYTHVKRANATTFCELSNLLTELNGAYCAVCQIAADPHMIAARQKFERYIAQAEAGLREFSWDRAMWVVGVGYLSSWRLLHRAQEALIYVEDLRQVALRAKYDELRLTGARIDIASCSSTSSSESTPATVRTRHDCLLRPFGRR